ncbi:hypothetical protein [Mycetohabitans endofungorum]
MMGGCATLAVPVKVSTQAEAAKIRFMNLSQGGWVALYPENECNPGVNIIYENLSDGGLPRQAMYDRLDPKDRNIAEYAFEPDQRVNVGMVGVSASQCVGELSFVVQASR